MSSAIIGEGVTGKFMLFLLPWNLKMIRIGWKVALVVFKGENGRRWDGKLPFLFNLPKAGSLHQNQIWRKRKERPKLIACDSINFLWTGQGRFICFSLLGFPSYFAQNVYHDHPFTIPPWTRTGTITNMTIMTTMTTMTPWPHDHHDHHC